MDRAPAALDGYAFSASALAIRCRTRTRSGPFARRSLKPVPSSGCSHSLTKSFVPPATWPCPDSWSTPRSSPPRSSAHQSRRSRRSRKAACRKVGRTSPPSSGRRTATRVGPSSTRRPSRARTAEPQVDLAIPQFGYQNHIGADRRHRLIRKWQVTDAAAHAGSRLKDLLDPTNTASDVWADSAYRSKKNEELLQERLLVSRIHRKKPADRPMPARIGAGERQEVGGAGACRARLCRAEGQHGPVRPHDRLGSGDDQDRARQPGPQYAPPALAGTEGGTRLNSYSGRSLSPSRRRSSRASGTQPA